MRNIRITYLYTNIFDISKYNQVESDLGLSHNGPQRAGAGVETGPEKMK